MSALRHLGAVADWRSWAVFRRNAFVFFRNWKTAFLPPVMEPIVYFLAFGLGRHFLAVGVDKASAYFIVELFDVVLLCAGHVTPALQDGRMGRRVSGMAHCRRRALSNYNLPCPW